MMIQTTLADEVKVQRGTAHNLACDRTPHNAFFLIANARLEANLNQRKESLLKIPNRKRMPFSRIAAPYTDLSLATSHSSLVTQISREDPPRRATAFPWPPWRLIYGTAIRNHRKRLKTWHRDPLRSTVNGGDRKADLLGTQTPRNTFSNCVPAKCVKLEGQFNLGDIHDTRLHGAV